ncbi:hypothetical protein Aperf_G00000052906 [Anoplocephala perfoliata]
MAPVLGYWDIRGLGEMCRLLFRYCGVEFEEKLYMCGPAPEFDRIDWFSKKYTLGLDFPNLPYYIDGDFKLTQSAAILEYIADKHDMVPTCKKRRAVLHMINDDVNDFRNSFRQIVYNPDFKNLLNGEKVNYPDFNLCELLNQLVKLDSTCLDGHSKLKAYLHRFENLPALKDYVASEYFKNRACNNKRAQWGGDK